MIACRSSKVIWPRLACLWSSRLYFVCITHPGSIWRCGFLPAWSTAGGHYCRLFANAHSLLDSMLNCGEHVCSSLHNIMCAHLFTACVSYSQLGFSDWLMFGVKVTFSQKVSIAMVWLGKHILAHSKTNIILLSSEAFIPSDGRGPFFPWLHLLSQCTHMTPHCLAFKDSTSNMAWTRSLSQTGKVWWAYWIDTLTLIILCTNWPNILLSKVLHLPPSWEVLRWPHTVWTCTGIMVTQASSKSLTHSQILRAPATLRCEQHTSNS